MVIEEFLEKKSKIENNYIFNTKKIESHNDNNSTISDRSNKSDFITLSKRNCNNTTLKNRIEDYV